MAGIVFTLCVWLSVCLPVCLLSCVSSSNVVPDTPTVWTTTKAVFSAALCLFANRFCHYNSSVTMQATVTKLWWLVNLLNSYSIHRQCYIFWADQLKQRWFLQKKVCLLCTDMLCPAISWGVCSDFLQVNQKNPEGKTQKCGHCVRGTKEKAPCNCNKGKKHVGHL